MIDKFEKVHMANSFRVKVDGRGAHFIVPTDKNYTGYTLRIHIGDVVVENILDPILAAKQAAENLRRIADEVEKVSEEVLKVNNVL